MAVFICLEIFCSFYLHFIKNDYNIDKMDDMVSKSCYDKEKRWINNMKKRTIIIVLLALTILLAWRCGEIMDNTAWAEELSEREGVLHAFYPANAVCTGQIKKYIDDVDSLSFAWSRIDGAAPGELNTIKGKNGNYSFYYPEDYLTVAEYAKNAGKAIQLNVYMKGSDGTKLLPYEDMRSLMIGAIIKTLLQDISEGEGVYFDGIVIDFEGLRDTDASKKPIYYEEKQISTYFTQFLKELKQELDGIGKKLYVAVNPRLYFDGYDYREILDISDHVIVMAHDYEPSEKLRKDQVSQYTGYNTLNPVHSMAPVQMIRQALEDIEASASNLSELSKVWLQLCFDSAQWKYEVSDTEAFQELEASSLSTKGKVTPLYKTIKARIDDTDGNTQNIVYGYNNELQTPYIQYYNKADQTWNIILYEDSNSIRAKLELAKKYGIGGISIWSLYNIPDYTDDSGKKYYLDGWDTILNEMEEFDTLSSDYESSVTFKDSVVEQAVRDKLGIADEDLTKGDLLEVYRLKLPEGVKSLSDLTKLKNLEYLDAGNLGLKDISVLKSLTNLRVLYLNRNEISDITSLKKLKKLELLSLNGNQITSISPLSSLISLQKLYLRENMIVDIAPVSELTALNTLELGSNQIVKLKVTGKLSSLRKLSAEKNNITDISGLKNMKGLQKLDISNNKLTKITYVQYLSGLKELYLQRNSISMLQPLTGLKNLKLLSLNGNRISDPSPLAKLISLEKLYLKENSITDITSLKALINLQELYLSGNKITDFSPVKELQLTPGENCDFKIN